MVVENKKDMWCHILSFLQLEFNVYLPRDHMVSVFKCPLQPTKKLGHNEVWGTVVVQWLRCCATNQKVAGSIPAGVIGIFH